jgi:hypothetical protein
LLARQSRQPADVRRRQIRKKRGTAQQALGSLVILAGHISSGVRHFFSLLLFCTASIVPGWRIQMLTEVKPTPRPLQKAHVARDTLTYIKSKHRFPASASQKRA